MNKSVPTRPGMGHANAKIGASWVLTWQYRHKLSPTNVPPPNLDQVRVVKTNGDFSQHISYFIPCQILGVVVLLIAF